MITSTINKFLNEIGLTDIQIKIYNYLLTHKFGTINNIKTDLNYSYTQLHHNLMILEEIGLIESSDSNPRVYLKINPKIALTELINKKFNAFQEKIKKLDEELKIQESEMGRCAREISFYKYSNLNLAFENYYTLIENTHNEIIMSSLPISLLKRLEPALYQAFMRGIQIRLYFSDLDFEKYPSYLEEVTNTLKRTGTEIIQTKEKTCQLIKFDDEIVNMGHILIDEDYLNSVIFKEDDVFQVDGFRGPFAKQAKKMLEIKTVEKRIKIGYPRSFKEVLGVIDERNTIKTRDLSKSSGIGGTKLKEILNYLVREGVIKEHIKSEGVGRPGIYYSIVE